MKNIKKIFAIGLVVLLTLCMGVSLVGCKVFDKKTGWYTRYTLETCHLDNLPKPTFTVKYDDDILRGIYGDIEESEFHNYAQRVLNYMEKMFEYFGTGGDYVTKPSYGVPKHFIPCEQVLENYRSETEESVEYLFVYFTEKPSPETVPAYGTSWIVQIEYFFAGKTYSYKNIEFTYNFIIKLKKYGVATDYIYPMEDKSVISLSPEIESQFDLSQEKVWWTYDENADFTDSEMLVCFKKTDTYPELSVADFNFENTESIEYISLRPSEFETPQDFTQIAVIHLKEKGRDKVIEAVRYFERISIIYCAEPNHLDEPC